MLQPGSRVGVYEIISSIGSGGMGVIYRARDVRLGRDVALKVLPEKSCGSPDAVARFRFEAQAASALNHPHILTIYDIGETEEDTPRRYIAMEYIAGETLRARIATKREPGETLDLLIQIGEGLAKAHEADIVHRDLKPDNIMITADGYAKILDFGLAKLADVSQIGPDSSTPTAPSTEPGTLVGTPQYMSPEQLRGVEIDQRSDIFAFGAVAYEALSGQRAFRGIGLAEMVHQITAVDPPPLRTLDERIPPELQRVISRCLAKRPDARYASMREVVAELKRVRERMRETTRRLPRLVQLTFARAVEQFPALSPDGRQLVFAREIGRARKLILSEPAESSERQLTRGDFDEMHPAWLPDGRSIVFVRAADAAARFEPADVFGRYSDMRGDIWTIDLAGDLESGKETRVIENAFNPSWSPDGARLAFDASWSGPRRIWIADARGRNAQQLTTDDSEATAHVRPRWSPDGGKIVFQSIEGTKSDVRLVDVRTRELKWVTNDFVTDVHPVWSFDGGSIVFSSYRGGGINIWRIPVDLDGTPAGAMQQITAGPGHDVDLDTPRSENRLVFAILKQNAELWRLPIDPATGEAAGAPEQVVAGSRENTRGAWSPDGERIAFGSDRTGEMNLWLLSLRDGKTRRLTTGAGGDYQPNWSPDARSLVFFSGRAGAIDIWRYDFDGETLTRLTRGEGININPFFSHDGTRIAFQSDRDGRLEIFVMNADGSNVKQLTNVGAGGHFLRWSADGAGIVFRSPAAKKSMTVPAAGGEAVPTAEVIGGSHMSFSPDQSLIMDVVGHRTLWCSPQAGGAPRRVFEFDDADSRIDYPVWSPDGRWILFDRFLPQGGDVWAVEE
ncbi:MAG TPA: protein kinase [Thermoanaerobaculia bacterium]|nr:protein kinase [Thermoanaerobaculia bacterium]